MPVLEHLQLRLTPPTNPTSPALLAVLSTVRAQIGTASKFYTSLDDKSLIYIIGQWPSLAAHTTFLHSPQRATILAPQEKLCAFVTMGHIEGGMDAFPAGAPLVAFVRLRVREECVSLFEAFMRDVYLPRVRAATAGRGVVGGWGLDEKSGAESGREYFQASGWRDRDELEGFREGLRRECVDYARVPEWCFLVETGVGVDMEA